jgi:hypothetical protein
MKKSYAIIMDEGIMELKNTGFELIELLGALEFAALKVKIELSKWKIGDKVTDIITG